jgi:hypothetical protein
MLAFFLLCCTCGVGIIVYLIIYYSKPENRCIHCYSIVETRISEPYEQPIQSSKLQTRENIYEISQKPLQTIEKVEREKFCPYCGLNIPENARYCPGCGAKVI